VTCATGIDLLIGRGAYRAGMHVKSSIDYRCPTSMQEHSCIVRDFPRKSLISLMDC